jgi:hypothetical protein
MLVLLTHPYYVLPIINVGADRAFDPASGLHRGRPWDRLVAHKAIYECCRVLPI